MTQTSQYSWKRIGLLIVLAYLFSFAVRMYWVYLYQGTDSFMWNNELMINTNDGYFFGSMAQKILEGMHLYNPRVLEGWHYAIVAFTVLFAKITPFSLETIILYMPALISSLVVIPIILIGKLYRNLPLGFFAALIGSVAWSYYNRTMVGYYDTDMFSAMAPMLILYFLLATIETEKNVYALFSALSILIYPFLYDSGLSLVYAMGIFYMIYMVVFHRQEKFTYYSIILISLALMGMPWYFKLVLIMGGYLLLKQNRLALQHLMIASGLAVLIFFITGNVFSLIYAKLMVYTVRGTQAQGLMFYQVAQTVREAGQIPFTLMANRISGSTLGVIVSLVGYIVLVVRHKSFILALPLIGIGVFSLVGGLRFTVFAVPVAAISAVYLFYSIVEVVTDKKELKVVLVGLFTLIMLVPNISHIIGYKVPTVFSKPEVELLEKLKNKGSDKDYIIAWWDYGYPLWFFTNKNTLIDGGKHQNDNYLVSRMLTTSSAKEAAQLSRISVETYVKSGYETISNTLFNNGLQTQVNVEDYFDELKAGAIEVPKATRDIYFYLPLRMLSILPTVKVFSNIDLSTGRKISDSFFYQATSFKQNNEIIDLGSGVNFNQKTGLIHLANQEIPINKVVTVGMNPSQKVQTSVQSIHKSAPLVILILQAYNKILILDQEMYNSMYIQMFFLENYDHNLFEAVELSPYAKIYKVKI